MFNNGFKKIANTPVDRAKIKAIGNLGKQVKTVVKNTDIPMRPAGVNLTDWYEKHLPRLLKERGQ